MTGFTRRASLIDAFWDAIVRGESRPDATGIPSEQADTVRWFQRLSTPVPDPNRDRVWSALEQRIRTEQQSEETHVMNSTYALAPPVRPAPLPAVPAPRALPPSLRSRTMTWVSIGLLIAMLGALAYGIFAYQDRNEPTLPAVVGTPSPESSPLGSDWGQFRGGVERTGYTTDPGPGGDLNLQWSFTADESLNGIMEANGIVFAYGSKGGLYAIDALTGAQIWSVDTSNATSVDPGNVFLPAVANGTVSVTTLDGVVFAFDADSGAVRWQSQLDSLATSAPTAFDDLVLVITDHTELHALDAASGVEQWAHPLPDSISTQYPTVVENAFVYPGDSGAVSAVDLSSGETLWQTEPMSAHRVAAYRDGRFFVPTTDGRMVALDASDGSILWETESSGNQALNPVVTDTAVLLSISGNGIQALDPGDGHILWTAPTPRLGGDSPHGGGNQLYVNLGGQTLSMLDLATGKEVAQTDTPGAGSTTAIFGPMLVVGGKTGPIRAFGPAAGLATQTTGSLPAQALMAATPVDNSESSAAIQAPASSDIQADVVFSTEDYRDTAMSVPDPLGRFWNFIYSDGSIDIYDRDFDLLDTWNFGTDSDPGQFNWTTSSSENPSFYWISASAAWLPDGTALVTDLANGRIQKVGPDGTVTGIWGPSGEFQNPVAVVVTPDDQVIVADIGRRDLRWFDLDGNVLHELSGPGDGEPFGRPADMVQDANGDLWVMDLTRQQIFKLDAQGNLLLTIGRQGGGSEPGNFRDVGDLDLDDAGNLWVADPSNQRIQVFDSNGNLLAVWDGCAMETGCFGSVAFLLAEGNGYVYVYNYDPNGVSPSRMTKFRITSMPDVPIMAAATPAAPPEASPTAG